MPQSPKTHRPFSDRADDDQARAHAAYEAKRGHSGQRGYGHKWRQARAAFLRQNPLCAKCCERLGRVETASVVDHIRPPQGRRQACFGTNRIGRRYAGATMPARPHGATRASATAARPMATTTDFQLKQRGLAT